MLRSISTSALYSLLPPHGIVCILLSLIPLVVFVCLGTGLHLQIDHRHRASIGAGLIAPRCSRNAVTVIPLLRIGYRAPTVTQRALWSADSPTIPFQDGLGQFLLFRGFVNVHHLPNDVMKSTPHPIAISEDNKSRSAARKSSMLSGDSSSMVHESLTQYRHKTVSAREAIVTHRPSCSVALGRQARACAARRFPSRPSYPGT